jgi:chaperonin GroEL
VVKLEILVAEEKQEALSTLVVNKLKGSLKIAAVKSPGFGARRKDMLEDLAIITGGLIISEERGLSLENVSLDMLGSAENVTIDKDNTTIVNGAGDINNIKDRVNQLEGQITASTSHEDKMILKGRLAKIAGGVAVLYVGAATEIEMREKKDRVDDALAATKAAVEEGIVAGGGIALLKAKKKLLNILVNNTDEETGVSIISKAIEAPFRTICENAGVSSDVKLEGVLSRPTGTGYNAKSDEYVEMFDAGIIDPCKVTRVALENAASVAGMILTTECGLINLEADMFSGGMPPMGGGMPGIPGMM